MSLFRFVILLTLCWINLCWIDDCWVGAGTIYYFKDKNGVVHFTDLPTSNAYRPFLIFRDKGYDPHKLERLIQTYSKQYGLDPALVKAVVKVESNFDPKAVSVKGAQGLMQIMPSTQKDLDLDLPFDPALNLKAGIKYLRMLLKTFKNIRLALAAYNAGPGAVKKYGGIPPFPETQNYVRKVLTLYNQLR